MGTAWMKQDNETDEEGKKREVSMEWSPDTLSLPNQNNINKHNMVLFYMVWKKYNEIQYTKIKMDLNNGKMTNHRPSPV